MIYLETLKKQGCKKILQALYQFTLLSKLAGIQILPVYSKQVTVLDSAFSEGKPRPPAR